MKSAFACIVEHFTNTSRLTLKSTAEFRNGIRPPTISSDNNGEKKNGRSSSGVLPSIFNRCRNSSLCRPELGSQPSPPFFKIIISIFLKRLSLTA